MLKVWKYNRWFVAGIVALATNCALADDLLSTLTLALEVDTTLKSAEQNQYATMELLPQARALLLPLINGTANTSYTNSNNPIVPNNNSWAYTLTISQPILNLSSWYQYRQVDDQIKSAVANYQDAKQDLMVRVSEQYFNILRARDLLIFAASQKKAFARQLEQTKQKFRAGVIAITDVNEAQARYDESNAQLISAQNALFDQKEIMGEITGVAARNVSTLGGTLNLVAPPDTIEKWVETALKQNFGLQSKLFDMSSAQKNIGIQRSGHYPIIQADGSASKGKTAPPNPTVANTNTIGVTISLPIYAGGSITSQTRQAAFEYEVSLQAKIAAERELVSNTRQAYRGIYTQISQVEALKQTVISSKSALDATQAAFNVGTRTIVDVLDAETDLLNAQRNLSTSRYDYILESFRLKRYAGILALNDIEIINRMLEPTTDEVER